MSMNKDEALRCLQISKEKSKAGDTEKAIKFAKKSLALCETSEGREWMTFLSSRGSAPSSTSSSTQASATGATPRHRGAAKAEESTSASRPYTPEQVEGIKRIKACKAKGDLYAVLGLEKGSTDVEIKKAYRKLALQFHPDKCGAPGTDDAFKAIGHAFAVLGDADKKANYDRFGIDSEASPSSGGGGVPRGFGRSPFETEITPEELFNMFFNGGGFPGAGVRMHSFTPGQNFRHQQFRRHPRAQAAAEPQLQQFIQLLPVLLLFFFPLLSSLLGGLFSSGQPDPDFSFVASRTYNLPRNTQPRDVSYYVNDRAWNRWGGDQHPEKVRRYDRGVEKEWHRNLQHLCAQEQDRKAFRIQQAHGWFSVDAEKLKAAQEMKTPHCDRLRSWGSTRS
ncbi:hypothetical protein HDU85_007562 [Gaertneriomyces sp. JEL0708]|nr:hypothetical protein HDU85_007562 [Gaertneriomyces sp. JEL0708]